MLGRSAADVITFFKAVGSKKFDRSEWSQAQIWTSIELMCLCTFRAVQRGDLSADPVLASIALWYGDVIKHQADDLIEGMLPDWHRGQKAQQKAAENYGGAAARERRRELVKAIEDEILRKNVLSGLSLHQLIAARLKKRHGKKISPKTVERDLAHSKRKLDKPGLSRKGNPKATA